MTDIRDQSGRFLAILTVEVPSTLYRLILPVRRPLDIKHISMPDPIGPFLETVELSRNRWVGCRGEMSDVWVIPKDDVDKLQFVNHVILRGATEPTWLDHKIKRAEALKLAFSLMRFLRMSGRGEGVH